MHLSPAEADGTPQTIKLRALKSSGNPAGGPAIQGSREDAPDGMALATDPSSFTSARNGSVPETSPENIWDPDQGEGKEKGHLSCLDESD
jgi:hypothetical protein